MNNSDKIKKSGGVLLVPVEVIPYDMNIEQFVEGWKTQDPKVMQIVNTKCTLIEDYTENKDSERYENTRFYSQGKVR